MGMGSRFRTYILISHNPPLARPEMGKKGFGRTVTDFREIGFN